MSEPTRVLFIGGWGHHYLREHLTGADGPAVEMAACGDGVDDMARLVAEPHPAVAWIDDHETAIDRFRPDVVSVGAVYAHNGRWVEAALAAGVRVVSDKPIAASDDRLARLRRIVDADPDAVLLTEVNARHEAAFATAAATVAEGRIGRPVLAVAQKSYPFGDRPGWYDDPDQYPGTLLWVATHGFDFVEFVTGRTVTPVHGRSGAGALDGFPSVDDHTVTVCALEGGGTAVVHADYLRPSAATRHGDDRIRVAGTEGVVEVRDGRCLLHTGNEPVDVTDPDAGRPVGAALWAAVTEPDRIDTDRSLRLASVALAARSVSR